MEKERITFLDYLRCFACLMVIVVHTCEAYYGVDGIPLPTYGHKLWITIWDGISRISVPLFIITSAYLLVPMKEDMPWGKFYKKRFSKILPPFIFFLIIYSLLPALLGDAPWKDALLTLVKSPLNFPENAFHLWFMYPLFGLYLLIPFISPWLRTATARQERLFLLLWGITLCLPFINKYFGEVLGQCWWNQYYMLYDFSGYPGYLVLGHYIRYHINWSAAKRRAIGMICLVTGTAVTTSTFYVQAIPGAVQEIADLEIAWCFCIINCAIATFGAFILFTTITKPGKSYTFIREISNNSYGMYLIHMVWLPMVFALLSPMIPIGIAIPVIALASYTLCFISVQLLSYMPKSGWFIGCHR